MGPVPFFLMIFMVLLTYGMSDYVNAAVLEKEPPAMIVQTSDNISQSDDALDADIEVNFDDLDDDEWRQLQNQTLMVSTADTDDLDINGLPPAGVAVVITNEAVTVTKNPIHIEFTKELGPSIVDEIKDVAAEYNVTLSE